MKALIVAEPWISSILNGRKTWEMRTRPTSVRGPIGLIRKGSGQVVAVVDVVGSNPAIQSLEEYAACEDRHRIPPERHPAAFAGRWTVPWVLEHCRPLIRPVPYAHKVGAVIWVNLDEDVAAQVRSQL